MLFGVGVVGDVDRAVAVFDGEQGQFQDVFEGAGGPQIAHPTLNVSTQVG